MYRLKQFTLTFTVLLVMTFFSLGLFAGPTVMSSSAFMCSKLFLPKFDYSKSFQPNEGPTRTMNIGAKFAFEVSGSTIKVHNYLDNLNEVIFFDYSLEGSQKRTLRLPVESVVEAHFSRKEGLLLSYSNSAVATWRLEKGGTNSPDISYAHRDVKKIVSNVEETSVFSFSDEKIKWATFGGKRVHEFKLNASDLKLKSFIKGQSEQILEADSLVVRGREYLMFLKETSSEDGPVKTIGVYDIALDQFSEINLNNIFVTRTAIVAADKGFLSAGLNKVKSFKLELLNLPFIKTAIVVASESTKNLTTKEALYRSYYVKEGNLGHLLTIKNIYENNIYRENSSQVREEDLVEIQKGLSN